MLVKRLIIFTIVEIVTKNTMKKKINEIFSSQVNPLNPSTFLTRKDFFHKGEKDHLKYRNKWEAGEEKIKQ